MKLKELRKQHNLTQTDVSKIANKNQKTIANYESGETQPDFATLIKLANYFNVTIDYLLDHKSSKVFDTSGCTQAQIEVMQQIQGLDDFQVERVKAFIKGMQSGSQEALLRQQIEELKKRKNGTN